MSEALGGAGGSAFPDPSDHLRWADDNRAFYEEFKGKSQDRHRAWGVTVLFYAAVHEVKRLFHPKGVVSGSHDDTKKALRGRREWKTLASLYDDMLQKSWDSRYMCRVPDSRAVAEQERALEMVEREVQKLLHL